MKKWLLRVLCVTLCLLLAVGAANFLVDPFMQYRMLPDRFTFAAYEYDYLNPGLARNADYDAVLLGSSLAENADLDVYDTAFGARFVKLISLGGTPHTYARLLRCVFRTHTPRLVLWTLDIFDMQAGSATDAHELPEYLYDDNRLNDVSYLLNLRTLYGYTFKDAAYSLLGRSNRPILRGDVWSAKSRFGKDVVLAKKSAADAAALTAGDVIPNAADNLRVHLLPTVQSHPDTEFVFYIPPMCVSYWQDAVKTGVFDALFAAWHDTMQALLQEDNVRIFFFADRMEWTTDYDLYRDDIHFAQRVNNAMGKDMAQGHGEVTADTFAETLSRCQQALRTAAG